LHAAASAFKARRRPVSESAGTAGPETVTRARSTIPRDDIRAAARTCRTTPASTASRVGSGLSAFLVDGIARPL